MQNYLLTLAYDGTNYCGFQVQPNGRSVAQTFQDGLEAVLHSRPDIKGCSRTDAGVHALGFALNFHAETRIPPEKLPLAINQHLPPDIRVLCARVVPEEFHARYAAHTKTYLYRIHNHPIDSPLMKILHLVPRRLDVDAMQRAAEQFVGKHDFLALCAAGSSAAAHGDTVRTITDCHVTRKGDEVDIEVTADGYLYNMVRILAGTLCEVGGPDAARCHPRHPCQPGPQPGRADAARERAIFGEGGLRPMRKNRNRPESDEPLSEGRVEYLEAARQRVRNRRIRRTAVLLVLLTAVVLFATGIAGSSVAALKDLTDTARIALLPGSGWPQQTGVAELEQMAPLTGSFVELGDEGCVVWSRTGKKLNSIQSGYARPALAAGKTRFVLYNRSGNELRVESRTQNLYTKQLENSIFLCAMSDNGTLAVVTEDQTSMAKLLVYSPSMEQQLSWSMTSNDGTPLRMAFSPDSRKLAAAAVTVSGGQVMTNLYLINLASGDPVSLVNQGGVPQWLGWTSASTILAVYDTRAVLYNAGGGERAVYDFAGTELKDVSVDAAGNVALLLASGQVSQAVTLDKNLNVQFSAAVSAANSIVRAGNLFYLLADNAVECFDASGTQQWSQNLDTSPQALLANSKDLLLFSGNTVQKLEIPES